MRNVGRCVPILAGLLLARTTLVLGTSQSQVLCTWLPRTVVQWMQLRNRHRRLLPHCKLSHAGLQAQPGYPALFLGPELLANGTADSAADCYAQCRADSDCWHGGYWSWCPGNATGGCQVPQVGGVGGEVGLVAMPTGTCLLTAGDDPGRERFVFFGGPAALWTGGLHCVEPAPPASPSQPHASPSQPRASPSPAPEPPPSTGWTQARVQPQAAAAFCRACLQGICLAVAPFCPGTTYTTGRMQSAPWSWSSTRSICFLRTRQRLLRRMWIQVQSAAPVPPRHFMKPLGCIVPGPREPAQHSIAPQLIRFLASPAPPRSGYAAEAACCSECQAANGCNFFLHCSKDADRCVPGGASEQLHDVNRVEASRSIWCCLHLCFGPAQLRPQAASSARAYLLTCCSLQELPVLSEI